MSAETLRAQLAEQLRQLGIVRSDTIDAAIRRVPRHLFVPGTPLRDAYANDAVHTKHTSDGTSISAASQPGIVAMMLHQLDLAPGQRVLELGAATGYNAALLATLVGADGHVTTIDVDDDLVAGAREHLDAAGITGVEAVCADGALGHPGNAPYDRIVATVGAHDIPDAWLDQLGPDGRLVAPVRLTGAISRSLVLVRDQHGWTSPTSDVAVFMPLRGLGDDRRRTFNLTANPTGTGQVMLQTHRDNDPHLNEARLPGILDTPCHHAWTGVTFAAGESFEWFDLWLSCSLPNPLMRMTVDPAAREAGLVQPAFPTMAMATTSPDGALAYLTIRPVNTEDQRRYEVGVIAHGAAGARLADTVVAHAATWNQHYRHRPVSITLPRQPPSTDPGHGRFVLPRTHHPIVIAWDR